MVHFNDDIQQYPFDNPQLNTILIAKSSSNSDYSRLILSRCAMTAVRDTLCNLRPLEIPRPHISGLQFIPTRGRLGFYKSIRREGAQYGIQIKSCGPRRPALADACWGPVEPAKEINAESSHVDSNTSDTQRLEYPREGQRNSLSSSDDESHTSSQLSNCSNDSSKKLQLDEPEYPEPDYDTTSSVKIKSCDIIKTKF